jgi:hypothetical protein
LTLNIFMLCLIMKKCSKCSNDRLVSDFYKSSQNKDGLDFWCKPCRRVYAKDWNTKNRVPKNAKVQREINLKYCFGITSEQYNNLLDSQDGKCATCSMKAEDSTKNFHVDHDHSCCPGRRSCGSCIRGLLCANCNIALGMVNDSAERLCHLAEYIEQR